MAINLLPWRDALHRSRKKRYLQLLLAIAIVMVCCWLLLLWCYQHQLQQQRQHNVFWQQQLQHAQQVQLQLTQLRQQTQFYAEQLLFIRQNRQQYNQLLHFLNELVSFIPEESTLLSLEKNGVDLALSGVTEQAVLLEQMLQQAEQWSLVQQPVLTVTRVKDSSSYFRLTLQLSEYETLIP